jgi:hypothetical protein
MLVGVCAAQRQVLTVGGSNATHSDLPAAVAAAVPGAVVQVRPGNYTGFSTNKALRIVLDFTATTGSVSAPAGSAYAIEINGLPAGQQFALVGRGAAIGAGSLGAIRIANVGGSVVLDRLSVWPSATRIRPRRAEQCQRARPERQHRRGASPASAGRGRGR